MLEEQVRGGIEQRATRHIRLPGNADQRAFEEFLQDGVDIDPPDRLDIGLGDRLPVGHDGEGLQGGRAEPLRTAFGEQRPQVTGELGACHQPPSCGGFKELQGTLGRGEMLAQRIDGLADLLGRNFPPMVGDHRRVAGGAGPDRFDQIGQREGLGRGEDQRFNNLIQLHGRDRAGMAERGISSGSVQFHPVPNPAGSGSD